MIGVGDQKISDQEFAEGVWQRLIEFREWCRSKAWEYLKSHPRRKFYKLSFSEDAGDVETHAGFDEDDLQKIRDFIVEVEAVCADEDYVADAIEDGLNELDIDWGVYYPGGEKYYAYQEPPRAVGVDLDDVIYCTSFKVKHTQWFSHVKDELVECNYNIKLSDEQYVELLSARLFDEQLTFYDLRLLNEEIYREVDACCSRVHESHVIFMTEIDKAAEAIMSSLSPEEKAKCINFDGLFFSVAINYIANHFDQFGDEGLMKSVRIAMSEDYY